MSGAFEGLWHDLRAALKASGDLPLRADVLTPAEIAEYVRGASGDDRAHRFVWEYYYPHFYGEEDGALTDDEAAALVASLKKQPPAEAPAHTTHFPSGAPHQPLCSVCHRREAQSAKLGARS